MNKYENQVAETQGVEGATQCSSPLLSREAKGTNDQTLKEEIVQKNEKTALNKQAVEMYIKSFNMGLDDVDVNEQYYGEKAFRKKDLRFQKEWTKLTDYRHPPKRTTDFRAYVTDVVNQCGQVKQLITWEYVKILRDIYTDAIMNGTTTSSNSENIKKCSTSLSMIQYFWETLIEEYGIYINKDDQGWQ